MISRLIVAKFASVLAIVFLTQLSIQHLLFGHPVGRSVIEAVIWSGIAATILMKKRMFSL